MTSLLIQSDTHSDEQTLQTALEAVLQKYIAEIDEHELAEHGIDFIGTTQHSDWERGDPCPECGNTRMSVMSPIEEVYHSGDGRFEYGKNGELTGPPLSIMCMNCEELLRHLPYDEF